MRKQQDDFLTTVSEPHRKEMRRIFSELHSQETENKEKIDLIKLDLNNLAVEMKVTKEVLTGAYGDYKKMIKNLPKAQAQKTIMEQVFNDQLD